MKFDQEGSNKSLGQHRQDFVDLSDGSNYDWASNWNCEFHKKDQTKSCCCCVDQKMSRIKFFRI